MRIARGTVLERLDGALIIECAPWFPPVHDPTVEHPDGTVPVPVTRTIEGRAYAHELEKYGPLLGMFNGNLQPTPFDPGVFNYAKYVSGPAYVCDVPVTLMSPGKSVKIVVAPESYIEWHGQVISGFKASFTLEGEAPPDHGYWMWNTHGRTSLDRR